MKRRFVPIALVLMGAAGIAGCGDGGNSSAEERGLTAVEACADHRGVVAFEDNVVICGDQTFFEVEE
jgi:hypothetical protein